MPPCMPLNATAAATANICQPALSQATVTVRRPSARPPAQSQRWRRPSIIYTCIPAFAGTPRCACGPSARTAASQCALLPRKVLLIFRARPRRTHGTVFARR